MTAHRGTAATATIVFTGLVGSTALRATLGEEVADELRRVHDTLLTEKITSNGGRVVKGGGDGLLAAFDSASAALNASVAMQQAIAVYNRRRDRIAELSIRIGLSAGDVLWEDGDCFGTPVVEAARLEAAAEGGQILCSELVRMMARGRGGHELTPIGALHLKGLPEPLPAYQVRWHDAATEPADAALPLPQALAVAAGPFVGRMAEQQRLRHALADTARAAPTVIWLAGEPGIGKTRLATELATTLHPDGWAVLFGRCDEGLAVPYQPFAEALRHVVAHTTDEDLTELLGGVGASELAHLCTDLGHRLPGIAPASGPGTAPDQYRLFEAARIWLTAASQLQPQLLIIDDAHWATTPTLLLLNYLARTLGTGRVAFVVTLRDTECPDELRAIMDESTLRPGGFELHLTGLDLAEVRELAGATALSPDPVDPHQLHARTAGNPLFLRALLSAGAEGDTVTAAIRRRVGRLDAALQDTLRVAALIGLDFDSRILARATDLTAAALLDRLEQAVRAGLVEEIGGGGFRFAHGLVRDALAQAVGPARRVLVHRAIAQAFDALRPDDLAAVARHWSEAAEDPQSTQRAIVALIGAGAAAEAVSEHDGAALAYGRAVELMGDADTEDRARVGYALAVSRFNGGSFSSETEALYLDVVRRAASRGLDELRLDAATGVMFLGGFFGQPSTGAVQAMADLVARPPADARLAARAAALGQYIMVGPDLAQKESAAAARSNAGSDQFRQLGAEHARIDSAWGALRQARASADGWAMRWSRLALSEALPYARASEAIAHLMAAYEVPAENRQDTVWENATSHLIHRLLITGELAAIDSAAGTLDEAAVRRRDPFLQHVSATTHATLALLRGQLDQAESAVQRALRAAARLEGADVSGVSGTQMFSLRREQGRLEEIAPMMRIVARSPAGQAWQPGLAAIYAELGMVSEAAALLELLIIGNIIDIPDDLRAPVPLSYLADAITAVGDATKARTLYQRLQPWSGLTIASFVITCYGPVDRYLGMLALTNGELAVAERHLRDALSQCRTMGTPTYEAHCHYWLSQVAAARSDHQAAATEAHAALRLAIPIGMAAVARRSQAILDGTR
ncbi:MAG: ATP-binding protein [Acidimicrobiales bacterium]